MNLKVKKWQNLKHLSSLGGKQPYQNTKMSAVDRKKDYRNKETDLFAQILRGKMWNVLVHSLTLY